MVHAKVMGNEKSRIFGDYKPVNQQKVNSLSASEISIISNIQTNAKQGAPSTVAIFPAIMLVSYLGMMMYFRSIGGYRQVHLNEEEIIEDSIDSSDEEE